MARRLPDPADAVPGASELEAALARARSHAKNAVAEALEAGRALLDAASLAASGARAESHPIFARADTWIRRTSRSLADTGHLSGDLGAALAEALQAEIARWEQRARVDDDARAVLRAFLGLRELLWELGVRPVASGNGRGPDTEDAQPSEDRPGVRRVERVPVQG